LCAKIKVNTKKKAASKPPQCIYYYLIENHHRNIFKSNPEKNNFFLKLIKPRGKARVYLPQATKKLKNIRTFAAGLNQGGQRDAAALLFYLKAK